MLAKLIQPHGDKNWSFQVVGIEQDNVKKIIASFHNPIVKLAKPFLQGNSGDWIMIEFWTSNYNDIVAAAKTIANSIDVPYSIGSDFSKQEIQKYSRF